MRINEQIAARLLMPNCNRLQMATYSEPIASIGKIDRKKIVGEDGKTYQLEIQAFWDRDKGSDVRVIVLADDGGWRAFKPLTGDFIMRPDGSLG
jgi:hypothetical protein